MTSRYTGADTAPGPAHGARYRCPWPACGWWLDVPPLSDSQVVEEALEEHMDDDHPGWTLDALQSMVNAP